MFLTPGKRTNSFCYFSELALDLPAFLTSTLENFIREQDRDRPEENPLRNIRPRRLLRPRPAMQWTPSTLRSTQHQQQRRRPHRHLRQQQLVLYIQAKRKKSLPFSNIRPQPPASSAPRRKNSSPPFVKRPRLLLVPPPLRPRIPFPPSTPRPPIRLRLPS
jgi:hypothetical protein